ncbi:uncharacterized protein TA10570 [Theileria annulata]|uniref:Uncharacterized protein n=1 Tax=Theileria annulata TaxID=5874 RepID=Q4U914_THEAN|nr:uncharacterized protein TA10570 [Theileria annulata]CAI76689.1 hypothetical protein, conserved [Theileria annulata]|eukprot:XP_953314.1 hypothetical protein, conserved [Theileria annulata]
MERYCKLTFVITIVLVTLSCVGHVNSLSFPSFSDFAQRFYNQSNDDNAEPATRYQYKPPRSDVTNPLESIPGLKVPKFLKILSKLSEPLSKEFPRNFRRNYACFLVLVAFLVAYGFYGYDRNKKWATKLCEEAMPVLEENFAYIEQDPKPPEEKGWNDFEMYASGRTSCKGLLITFQFVKRQCFWHEHFIRLLYSSKDMVAFDVQFEYLDQLLFAVCRKVNNKSFVTQYPHLLLFSYLYEGKDLPDCFRAYVNSTDKSVVQFASHVLHLVQPFINNLEYFYLSDVVSSESELVKRPVLSCCFRLRKKSEDFQNLVKTMINLVDYCKNFSMPQKLREAVTKERSEFEFAYNKMNR